MEGIMAKTIELNKLNAMFAEYLASGEASFNDFMNKYLEVKEDGSFEFNDSAASIAPTELKIAELGTLENANKFGEYLAFLAKARKANAISDVAKTRRVAKNIADHFAPTHEGMKLSKEDARDIVKTLGITARVDNKNHKKGEIVGRNHPFLSFIIKWLLIPGILGAAACGIFAAIVGALGLGVGTIPLLTENVWSNIASLGIVGGVFTAATTASVAGIVKFSIWLHYALRGTLSDSIKDLVNSDTDVAEIDLAITRLVDKYIQTEADILSYDGKNPFKKIWNKLKLWVNRNRLTGINKFREKLAKEIEIDKKAIDLGGEDTDVLTQAYNRKVALQTEIRKDLFGALYKQAAAYANGDIKKLQEFDIGERFGDLIVEGSAYKPKKAKHNAKVRAKAATEWFDKYYYVEVLSDGLGVTANDRVKEAMDAIAATKKERADAVAKKKADAQKRKEEAATAKTAKKEKKATAKEEDEKKTKDNSKKTSILATIFRRGKKTADPVNNATEGEGVKPVDLTDAEEEERKREEAENADLVQKMAAAIAARQKEEEARRKTEEENNNLKRNQKFDFANMSEAQKALAVAKMKRTNTQKTLDKFNDQYVELNNQIKAETDEKEIKKLNRQLDRLNESIKEKKAELKERNSEVERLTEIVNAQKFAQ